MVLFLAPIGGGGAVLLMCCVAYAVRSHSKGDKNHEEESDVDSIGSETPALAPPTVAAINPGYLAVPEEVELVAQPWQHQVVQYAHQAGHQPQQHIGHIAVRGALPQVEVA